MGLSGIGPGSLILILVIVALLFGTKRLRNLGGDIGAAVKSFRKGVKDEDSSNQDQESNHSSR